MNDLRKATASLLAVSDSDETSFDTPTITSGSIIYQSTSAEATMPIATFNNLLYKIAVNDGFDGSIAEFGDAFGSALNGEFVVATYESKDELPDKGEPGQIYLIDTTGELYYWVDGEYKQTNRPSDEELKNLLNDVLKEEDNPISSVIEEKTKEYLDDNINQAISDFISSDDGQIEEAIKNELKDNPELIDEAIEKRLDDIISKHFEAIADPESKDDIKIIEDTLGENKPSKNDVFVIKREISDGIFEFTSYYFDGEKWCAMNGAVNADNVYFNTDFIVTEPIGTIRELDNGRATLEAKGKSLTQVLKSLLAIEKMPKIIAPSISLTSTTSKKFEVGSIVKPTWRAKFNEGSYEFGPETNITPIGWSITNNVTNETSTESSGKFNTFEIGDNTRFVITATASYSNGTVPVTNLGEEKEDLRIVAGSVSNSTSAMEGYRKTFFGITLDDEVISQDLIRSLESSTAGMKDGSVFSINVGEGATRVIIAYPANLGDISSVKKDGKYEIADKFKLQRMEIEGANGYKAIEYKVYVRAFDKEREEDCVYNVII